MLHDDNGRPLHIDDKVLWRIADTKWEANPQTQLGTIRGFDRGLVEIITEVGSIKKYPHNLKLTVDVDLIMDEGL